MSLPERKTSHLRRGRVSLPGATYFVTACTQNRAPVLIQPKNAPNILGALRAIQTANDAEILAATVMPDHVHLLFTLGRRLRLGQVLSKFKTFARDRGRAPWCWQNESFEHRLRPHESVEDYGFYIFVNPYRARLIPFSERWPWWTSSEPKRFLFLSHLGENESVPPEWVEMSDQVGGRITTHS